MMRLTSFLVLTMALLALFVVPAVASAESSSESSATITDLDESAVDGVVAESESGDEAHDENEVNPIEEFAFTPLWGTEEWLNFGPIDMAITRIVLYLWLSLAIIVAWALFMRPRLSTKVDRKQTFTETFYEFGHDQIAAASLGDKTFVRYMPFVASLFVFIWVINIVSFLPLPLSTHSVTLSDIHSIFPDVTMPAFAIYAATSNINVTLALTLIVIAAMTYEGVKHNGPIGWLKSFSPPGVPGGLVPVVWALEAFGRLLRVVSLSVRLFANLLAGHMLIAMMLGMVIILGNQGAVAGTVTSGVIFGVLFVLGGLLWLRGKKTGGAFMFMLSSMVVASWLLAGTMNEAFPLGALLFVPVALGFYLFEVGLVASLQAYIFALLGGIYIGTEAEPAH